MPASQPPYTLTQQPKGPDLPDLVTHYRTHTCGELRPEHVGQAGDDAGRPVTLCGHVDSTLDEGGFVIRDHFGRTLVTVHPDAPAYVADLVADLGREQVVQAIGEVELRGGQWDIDSRLPTGEVMLLAKSIDLLGARPQVPAEVLDEEEVPLADRLAFRTFYLRRPEMQERLRFRSRLALAIREYLVSQGFLELETPQLFWYDRAALASEPIPVGNGGAFALPGGGLVLDQYIVAGQFERFFQFMRITRREMRNQTPMHTPEHTLLDLNLTYVDREEFCRVVEGLVAHVFKVLLDVDLKTPFKSYSYAEAVERYGTDKVDTRFGLDLEDVPEGGRGFRVPGGANLSDDELWDLVDDSGVDAEVSWKRAGRNLDVKVAGPDRAAATLAAGALRLKLARRLGLGEGEPHAPVWIHSYPYLADDEGTLVPDVVVFSQPVGADFAAFTENPERRDQVRAQAFDLVIDGVEVASAYIGNHDLQVQRFIWEDVFLFNTPDLLRVRAPLEAHRFGVPPHGGMNLGFDRLVAVMLGLGAIDEAMFFPKTPDCRDPLLEAPGPVPAETARELIGAESAAASEAEDALVDEVDQL